jgi:hypothetical protein
VQGGVGAENGEVSGGLPREYGGIMLRRSMAAAACIAGKRRWRGGWGRSARRRRDYFLFFISTIGGFHSRLAKLALTGGPNMSKIVSIHVQRMISVF